MNEPIRLSDSRTWRDLRSFYENQGVAAWSDDTIPFFATNNPVLAKTYVDLCLAWTRDLLSAGLIDTEQSVTMVEVGGGSGRLAYLILTYLKKIKDEFPVPVTYLLTDYSPKNVEHYRQHERFQEYLVDGSLAVEVYNAEEGADLSVPTSSPIFAIGNYLFDTLSQDGFKVQDGTLYEVLVKEGKKPQLSAESDQDERRSVEFVSTPASQAPYGEPAYDHLLERYRSTLGNTHFPFPIGPLRCLRRLLEKSGGRLAFVMADKALRSLEELLGFEELPLQRHPQGFSMSVNCHAIDEVWKGLGGQVRHSAPRSHPLDLALYSVGLDTDQLRGTNRVFTDLVDGFGALDYLSFRDQIRALSEVTLQLCLQLLRLSAWDPELFYEVSNEIGQKALTAPLAVQRELYDAMACCWENFFPISDGRDVPFALARALACIDQFDQAISFYGESLRLFGKSALTYHNIGVCQFNLERFDEARESFTQALKIDPDYGPSRELMIRLDATEKERARLAL